MIDIYLPIYLTIYLSVRIPAGSRQKGGILLVGTNRIPFGAVAYAPCKPSRILPPSVYLDIVT